MTRGGVGRTAALLSVSTIGVLSLTRTWLTATGTRAPDAADVAAGTTPEQSVPETVHAAGVSGSLGATLLVCSTVLVLVALWRVSPAFRVAVAGWTVIVVSAVGIAGTVAFLAASDRVAAFGENVDVQAASIVMSWWPWCTLVCFAVCCGLGVATLPSSTRSAAPA